MILHWCVALIFLYTHVNLTASVQLIDDIYNELVATVSIDKSELYQLISQTIVQASDLEGLPNTIIYENHVYDLSSPCPINWALAFDGKTCIKGYFARGNHNCGRSIDIKDSTPAERIAIASICGVEYPVSGTLSRDYSQTCPENWKLTEKFCIAPTQYNGKCVKLKDFHNLTQEQRLKWSIECDAYWPYLPINYSNNCPNEWIEHEKFCLAPPNYTGSCDNKIEKSSLTSIIDKKKFASRCQAYWPLETSEDESDAIYDDSLCPIGWNIDTNSSTNCIAPIGYDGPCGSVLPTVKANDEKIQLSRRCGVRWYKLDNMQLLASSDLSDCPFGWTLVDNLCIAPPSYQGPCPVSIDMSNFTSDMKRIWAQICAAYFVTRDITLRKSLSKNYNYQTINRELNDLLHSTDDPLEKATIQDELERIKKETERRTKLIGGSRFIQLTDELPCDLNLLECPYGWIKLDNKRCLAPSTYRLTGGNCPDVIVPQVEARKRLHLNQSNLSTGCNIQFPCKTCIKDYVTSLCPINWSYNAVSASCVAPKSYPPRLRRICGDSVQFKFATPIIRRQWEMACEAEFPCASSCSPDYSLPCPKGFNLKRVLRRKLTNIAMCKIANPKSLVNSNVVRDCLGPNGTINILLNKESKVMAHKTCNVNWPCASRCNENFWQACPYNWVLIDNYCISPRDYTAPEGCPLRIIVDKLRTPLDKFKFSLDCHAKWPCIDYCQQDFSQDCPPNWLDYDGLCVRPDTTLDMEKARNRIGESSENESDEDSEHICNAISKESTLMERQEFSFKCKVAWPCGGSDTIQPNPNWQIKLAAADKNWENRNLIRYYSQTN
ncbi:Plasmodium falciparum CPW-WPC domain [Babesia microti strain RI]|uniref:Plasmodium falciparum CPW-WPC domain n=1 Tax=Babesia microti (strain RI) TaxID=1133968 RepID=A0A1R4AAD6_BABMR|nr:Plasmodium falciparum CPW-WPC domain [Babesia microti strain RI]SJK85968.1 Plasmodium falciparum CPW-WPC domain [Babesia microti strain RI]|eukprot:XP_021338170.1 Plasmodium falciparum CPW-WPC domain [Babesia microti strain RI]